MKNDRPQSATLFLMNTGYLTFVDHPKVAVHLRHFDFGSSETLPRHFLLLDRAEQRLYALPAGLAQQFLQLQWSEQARPSDNQPGTGSTLQTAYFENLSAALDLNTWQEVTPPGDFNAQVMAAMQHQDQLVHELVAWLDEQQKSLSPERMAEYEQHAPAMLMRHV